MGVPVPSGLLLDYTQDKIILIDRDGQVTYANQATERVLGWSQEEFIGKNAFEYIHPDDVGKAREVFRETIARETFAESSCELRYQTKDGAWKWLESRMSNVTDDELDGYVVSSRDITDRIEAQREREESVSRLTEISKTTGEVLWMFNHDWSELLFVNPAFEGVYGLSSEEVTSNPVAFLESIHPDDRPLVEDAMETLTKGEAVELEYRVNPEHDYSVWVWVQAQPIFQDGEVVRITGFSRDVTDRKRRERQLYVMDTLLRHNIRNDLGIIIGYAEQIETEAPEMKDYTTIIRQTGTDLVRTAEKERDVIEVLSPNSTPQDLDLVSEVTSAIATVSEQFPEAVFETSLPDRAPVSCLAEIRLAIEELLENAILYNPAESPVVEISVIVRNETVIIRVQNRGPPIANIEAQVLLGDHEMDDIYHSSGLGFWLVYWIVNLSGGHITVEENSADENNIEIRLPAQTG